MTKVDWHAAGDLLIAKRVGFVYSMIKKGGAEFATFPANGKQGPASMTNNKKVNEDQSHHETEWGLH
jgi:hypothetical protein